MPQIVKPEIGNFGFPQRTFKSRSPRFPRLAVPIAQEYEIIGIGFPSIVLRAQRLFHVCDEAHKMSATYFGGEAKYTKRYKLGQLLSTLTGYFLLMTATPHNGKE